MNVRIDGPRPDQRERQRELDLALPAGALAVHEALPGRGGLRARHARVAARRACAPSRPRRSRWPGACARPPAAVLSERAATSSGVASAASGKASNQARPNVVGSPTMRSEACVPPLSSIGDAPVVAARPRAASSQRAQARRARIAGVVAREEPHVRRPGGARGVGGGGLEADQHGLALAREDARVVALHAPEVRQVEHRVGRAHDERIELALGHQRAHALRASPRRAARSPAHPRRRGLAVALLPRDHRVAQHADALDLALHDVAGLEVERGGVGREAGDARRPCRSRARRRPSSRAPSSG